MSKEQTKSEINLVETPQLQDFSQLPEKCINVDAPQLSFEELDAIDLFDLNGISDIKRLEQIADSAATAAEVLMVQGKKSQHVLESPINEITVTSKDMAQLLRNGSFDINAQVAGSIVIAEAIFTRVSKVKAQSDATISYDEYRHILNAMATQFRGNSRTAATLNNVFAVFGSITESIAETNKKIELYQTMYSACADIKGDIEEAAKQADEAGKPAIVEVDENFKEVVAEEKPARKGKAKAKASETKA
ncbi:hypothetical protein MA9V2_108 [Chryseobacterium phage MA9V-2]|nr:hypothetical protein MA9V2_108 [Chryseobacterium phage MA9V-2]